ncbi:hypothetical protein DM860_002074 [Cuscuta australis]|uniref:DUF7392 domain-containing protein n=1 Tax=Cuscuta australis TaxID=267555 RepID=A0A328E048_9ASTE|nr:hypothetical protein DM860_002074 [Cuscuta australis]
MGCFIPLNGRNLDLSFFVLRPTIVIVDDLLHYLKHFSSTTQTTLGCIHSSVFRSIHGNLIVWYGAWIKRSCENGRDLLNASLLPMLLSNVSSMAKLIEYGFYDAYAGQTRDGTPAAKFYAGDIVSLHALSFSARGEDDINTLMNNFSYACLAIFKDRFLKMDGAKAGVCLKSERMRKVCGVLVWRSLQSCYSFILNEDYRTSVLPYLDDGSLSLDIKYDIFRVVYTSGGDNALNNPFYPPPKMIAGDQQTAAVAPEVVQDPHTSTARGD